MSIEIRHVSKRFGEFQALEEVSLRLHPGELTALLGPSGSGKTTLLRVLAGLETPDQGAVYFDGRDVTQVAPKDRGIGLVFQHYALFKHLDVFENVAFPLRVRRRSAQEINARVHELLTLVRLDGLGRRTIDQLSGGQRQRIALARALAAAPRVLLLDEPFGALDAKVRQELRRWLRRLHDELAVTTIFVTHDQEEAFEVADRVVITERGRIAQVGTPAEVHERPASRFVFDFLGQASVLEGAAAAGRARFGPFEVEAPPALGSAERAVVGYLRPHEVELSREGATEGGLGARISRIHPARAGVRVELVADGMERPIEAEIEHTRFGALALSRGERVRVRARRIHVFAAEA